MLKLLAFVLPLGLDSFAVAAAIGASSESAGRNPCWQLYPASQLQLEMETGAAPSWAGGPAGLGQRRD